MTGAGVQLVPKTWDPFALIEHLDEDLIRKELEGIASEELVYVIRGSDGKEVTGLSKVGVDESCNILAHRGEVIREDECTFQIIGAGEEREALFTVRAARYAVSSDGREVKLDQVLGTKRQPLYYEPREEMSLDTKVGFGKHRALTWRGLLEQDRRYIEWIAGEGRDEAVREFAQAILNGEDARVAPGRQLNVHWFEHGSMKAARNARTRLVPANVKAEVIARAKQAGKQKVVDQRAEDTEGASSMTTAAPRDTELTSHTPCPALKGKMITQASEAMLLWLTEPGRQLGVHTEIWQQLAHDEVKRRVAEKADARTAAGRVA